MTAPDLELEEGPPGPEVRSRSWWGECHPFGTWVDFVWCVNLIIAGFIVAVVGATLFFLALGVWG